MENQTELQIIIDPKIAEVAKGSLVDNSKTKTHMLAFAPSMNKVLELSIDLEGMNMENPSEDEVKTARKNRLDLVHVRRGLTEIKKNQKETLTPEIKLIDGLFSVVEVHNLLNRLMMKLKSFMINVKKNANRYCLMLVW